MGVIDLVEKRCFLNLVKNEFGNLHLSFSQKGEAFSRCFIFDIVFQLMEQSRVLLFSSTICSTVETQWIE